MADGVQDALLQRRAARLFAALRSGRALASWAALVAVSGLAGCGHHAPACPDCNVIWISIDTLRADRLGIDGYERDTSPNIDAFASQGVVFRNVISQHGATIASHKSIFTGLYVSPGDLAPRMTELLGAHGYRTAGFTGGGLMNRRFGFARGFDEYHDSAARGGLADSLPKVIPWLREHRDERFFLFLHTYDVHCPYTPPDYYLRMFVEYNPLYRRDLRCIRGKTSLSPRELRFFSDAYDGGVRWTDTMLGVFLRTLDDLSLLDKTIVVITSDHGEALGEDGYLGHAMLREEVHEVPLIIRVPGIAPRVTDEPAQLVDILPTTLGLLGIEPPANLDGVDLGPVLRGERPFKGRRPRISLGPMGGVMIRVDDDFVLIDRPLSDDELYDLHGDWVDVSASHPDEVARLRAALEELRRTRRAGPRLLPDPEPDKSNLEPELREQLKNLGYVE